MIFLLFWFAFYFNIFFSLKIFNVSCFVWACQDLPALYLKGGSIIPVGLPLQHVGEANPSDDLTLLVALDEHGESMHSNVLGMLVEVCILQISVLPLNAV